MCLPYMVCSIYWLLSWDAPLLDSYDILVAWEIIVALVYVWIAWEFYLRDQIQGTSNMLGELSDLFFECKPESFVDLA